MSAGLQVETLTVGLIATNCYLVWGSRKQALVIDPGGEVERIEQRLAALALGPVRVVLTHGHVDHVSALASLVRRRGTPVAMHPLDAAWGFGPQNALPPILPQPEAPPAIDRSLAEGQRWSDADLDYQILETPGHTPGGICVWFQAAGLLFSGDTLFAGGVGRTDLPGGDERMLAASLRRLARLPPVTRVFPGHGPATTIGDERTQGALAYCR